MYGMGMVHKTRSRLLKLRGWFGSQDAKDNIDAFSRVNSDMFHMLFLNTDLV